MRSLFGDPMANTGFFPLKTMVGATEAQGTALGLLNMGAFVGPAIAQPLFGYLLDLGWGGEIMEGVRVYPLEAFQQGLWLCCFLAVLGFISALLVRETYHQKS